jgi:phosphoheptose isomerase
MNKIRLNEYKSKVRQVLDGLDLDSVIRAAEMIASCEGIVWTFGNGHGLAVAEAFALDLVKHAGKRALCISSAAIMSAYSNDHAFVHWPSALLGVMFNACDLAVGFSFKGSENVFAALRTANRLKAKAILMTSQGTVDHLWKFLDHSIVVPSDDIQVVEDVWSSICHMICNEVRKLK